jgi:hypothetical protein
MDEHLDLLALDAVRAGDASPEQRAHAERCADCRASVDHFRGLAARLAPAPVEVPPFVEARIRAIPRTRAPWRRWTAAAAALLIGMGGVWLALNSRPAIPGDVDQSGRVDIVDAYALAVRLRSGQKLEALYDVNGDGKVDERDVDEIARRSVAIR